MIDADNVRRWAPDARGVYEVWYLTWNHPGTGQGYWLRFITENPLEGPPRGELWFARFDPRGRTFGIHRRFPQVASLASPFELRIGGCELRHNTSRGTLVGDGHEVRWDLRWLPAERTLHLLPSVMYRRGGIADTNVLMPNPRVPLTGTLSVDGEELSFDHAVAGQTHLWGKKHAYAWTWGRCAELGTSDGVLEMFSGRLQRRGITLPATTLVTLDLEGERYRWNQFRHVLRNRGSWQLGLTKFSAWSPFAKLEGELSCRPDQMVNAPYLDPDGTEVFCANTEIGDAKITLWRRHGLRWVLHRTLEGRGRAHFEIGGRERAVAVTHDHRLVAD